MSNVLIALGLGALVVILATVAANRPQPQPPANQDWTPPGGIVRTGRPVPRPYDQEREP